MGWKRDIYPTRAERIAKARALREAENLTPIVDAAKKIAGTNGRASSTRAGWKKGAIATRQRARVPPASRVGLDPLTPRERGDHGDSEEAEAQPRREARR